MPYITQRHFTQYTFTSIIKCKCHFTFQIFDSLLTNDQN